MLSTEVMMRFATLLLSGLLALPACTHEQDQPETKTSVPSDPNREDTVDPVAEPSPELEALIADVQFDAVQVRGPMHGYWDVRRGDETIATLRFKHEKGTHELDGIWTMKDDEDEEVFGKVHSAAAKLGDDELVVHWDVDGPGVRYRYGISDAKFLDDGRIRVRLAEQRSGRVSDAYLVPVPK